MTAAVEAGPTHVAAPSSPTVDWQRYRKHWPHAEFSEFVAAGGVTWHVQRLGQGPVALLLHGTGASTHSWRKLLPLLADRLTLIAPDLPGHGFTSSPPTGGHSMGGMASTLAALLAKLGVRPAIAIGHSAGAALAVRACLDELMTPQVIVSINGSLIPALGIPHQVFAPVAGLMANVPGLTRLIAAQAGRPAGVERLMAQTGSRLDDDDRSYYASLFATPAHVRGVLRMMANWDLQGLSRELKSLRVPLRLLVGENDTMVSPNDAERVLARVANAEIIRFPGAGHLLHEECPEPVAERVLAIADRDGATP